MIKVWRLWIWKMASKSWWWVQSNKPFKTWMKFPPIYLQVRFFVKSTIFREINDFPWNQRFSMKSTIIREIISSSQCVEISWFSFHSILVILECKISHLRLWIFIDFCIPWRLKLTTLTNFRDQKIAKIAGLELLDSAKLISHKILKFPHSEVKEFFSWNEPLNQTKMISRKFFFSG